MKRRRISKIAWIIIIIFSLLFFISCVKTSESQVGSVRNVSSKLTAKSSQDGGPEIPAPLGASAKWLQSGSGIIDANGTNPAATIVITGPDEFSCYAKVKVLARFGSLREALIDEEIAIGARQQLTLPLALKPVLSLHEKQALYVTRIKAAVSFIYFDDKAVYRQKLEERYLALDETTGKSLVMDGATMLAAYPNGITNAAELARVQAVLAALPEEDRQGPLIEPGVYADSADDDVSQD
ncbi:MAG: hypothetical protein GX444_11455 [Myxococcales bacterium]|nr:hypothetical protein [Myxococcales bacterium]